jgi:hypothetical protein
MSPISDALPSDPARLMRAHALDREAGYQASIREVRCTTCDAGAGAPCLGSNLLPGQSHPARIRAWRSFRAWAYGVET